MVYEIILGRNVEEKKRLGTAGSVFLGKHYIKMGAVTALSNPVYLDVNKAHVVFVVGKRGSGKCLHGDALISLDDGSSIPIKELADNKEQVMSLSKRLKIEPTSRSDFFSRKVERLLKIKLRSGKEIKLTPEHPLLTIKGWKPAEDLKLGSRIATPRILSCFGKKEMPEHEIKLLSYLIAGGHTKKIVLFTNSDKEIVKDFKDALRRLDSSLELAEEKRNHYRVSSSHWRSRILEQDKSRNEKGQFVKGSKNVYKKRSIRKLIEREGIFDLLSTQKFLSNNIMQLKKGSLALFLDRLFSCDGSIYKVDDYWEISYSSSSEKMIRQLQHLLLRFGILSKLRSKRVKLNNKVFDSYELVINSENSLKFIEEIGFFGKKAEKQLIAQREILSKIRNPNVDTVPKEIWEVYRPANWAEIGRQIGYKHPKAMREKIRYSPSRQTLLQIAKLDQNKSLKLIAESDIFWDEIIGMELLEGEFTVYDISVPNNHNFVANDIIVHNSYTLGVIAEGIATLPPEFSQRLSVILFDTMGIYWTMKYPNHKDEHLLKEWELEGKGIDVKIYTPFGFFDEFKERGIPTDFSFSIKPSELSPEDWNLTFELNPNSPLAVFIERLVLTLKKERDDFDIDDILRVIEKDEKEEAHVKRAAVNRFSSVKGWGVFSREATAIKELVRPGQITVLDLSAYAMMPNGWKIKYVVTGIICKKMFIERLAARKNEEYQSIHSAVHYIMEEEKPSETPMIWLMVDECHEFLPKDEKVASSDALITLLREGRQPGIALVLSSQQPGKIHTDVMTQSDVFISHRLTAKMDTDALESLMQSYLRQGLDKELNILPRVAGAALALDDVNERIYPMRVRPRFSWHGGSAPEIIKEKKKIFEF